MQNRLSVTQEVNMLIQNAGKIAIKFGQYKIDTEHVLYGITCIENSIANKILASYKITKEKLENIFSRNSQKSSATVINANLEFTDETKEVFLFAEQFAEKLGSSFITCEHLLVALLLSENSYAVSIIKKIFKVNINDLKHRILQIFKSNAINKENIVYDTQNQYVTGDTNSNVMSSEYKAENSENLIATELPQNLLDIGQDLTLKAKSGKIDNIIGRHEEISRLIEILCRKTKNNPVLIGESGVGKSAIVEGLAIAISRNEVPALLKGKIIYSLEIAGLVAGTKFRGSLEEKLKNIINYITSHSNIIVFIDEIHTLIQAGGDKGEVNPADILKPYLSKGEFQTIGATTTDEYKKYIETDKALERRFQPIMVNPPSVDDTIKILQGLKVNFENYHNVIISDEAINAAVVYSDRYIMDRNLPDKAIDLIDEAGSKAKIQSLKNSESKLLENEISELESEKRNALQNNDFEKASELRDKIYELKNKHSFSSANFDNKEKTVITDNDIMNLISKVTGIPVSKITESEKEKLIKLESILHKRVIGQDEAVSAISKAIRRARTGLKDLKRPIGSFMFLGQSGVGKTELCKALAEAMFDNESNFVRLDMSEYSEKHSVSKLIGSPPGYAGFNEGGQLTEQVRKKPYSVILFDEIEKAHPDIYNVLLQVLDDGRLTDSQGRLVSFKNTIIIFTSNIGVYNFNKKIGGSTNYDYNEFKSSLLNEIRENFKPEFINRIDVITVFHSLSMENLAQIAKIFITNLNNRLKEKNIGLKITESALKYLIIKGYSIEYGARPLRRLIEQEIEDKIAENMLTQGFERGATVIISAVNGDKLDFKYIVN